MGKKLYAISLTTALAAGYAAGFASEGWEAHASQPVVQTQQFVGQLGPAAQSAVESWAQSQFCAALNAQYELTGDLSCSGAESFDRVRLSWTTDLSSGERIVRYDVQARVAGVWVPGAGD